MSKDRLILKDCPISGFADEIDADMDKQIALLKQLGLSYIEFRSAGGINVADYTIDQAKVLKEKLDANSIKLSAVGSPIGKIGIEDDFAPHLEKLDHVMELAKIFETDKIRMFSFYMPKDSNPDAYRDEVLRRTEAMVAAAAKQNILLLHENEKGIYGDMAVRCLDLMKQFYGPNYQCTFDFANFVQCGQDPLEAYEMLAPYVSYIHVKDAMAKDGLVVPAGQGDGKLKEVFTLLDKAGYQGFLSLEPHLTDFIGLQNLEQDGAAIRGRSDGETAFCQAHAALLALL